MLPAGRVFQQSGAAALGKAATQQEVTVAAHHIEWGLAGELLHGREHGLQESRIIIIAHPVFEQVTQDEQAVDLPLPLLQGVYKQLA
jgi:hypothetical protein